MTIRKSLSLLIVFFTIASCSTMGKQACLENDWKRQGFEDAYEGQPQSEFDYHKRNCGRFDVKVNKHHYFVGYKKGLKKFCTPERAKHLGRSGKEYFGQCPSKVEKAFLREYNFAYREYQLDQREQKLREREEEVAAREHRAVGIEDSLRTSHAASQNQCNFNSDCTIELSCTFNRCERTGKACSFDSDCEIEGSCTFDKCTY